MYKSYFVSMKKKTKIQEAKENGVTYRAIRYFLKGEITNPTLLLLRAVSKIYGYKIVIENGEYQLIIKKD